MQLRHEHAAPAPDHRDTDVEENPAPLSSFFPVLSSEDADLELLQAPSGPLGKAERVSRARPQSPDAMKPLQPWHPRILPLLEI